MSEGLILKIAPASKVDAPAPVSPSGGETEGDFEEALLLAQTAPANEASQGADKPESEAGRRDALGEGGSEFPAGGTEAEPKEAPDPAGPDGAVDVDPESADPTGSDGSVVAAEAGLAGFGTGAGRGEDPIPPDFAEGKGAAGSPIGAASIEIVSSGQTTSGAVSPGTVSPRTVSLGTASPEAASLEADSPGAVSPGAVPPGTMSLGAVSPEMMSPSQGPEAAPAAQPGAAQPGVGPAGEGVAATPLPDDGGVVSAPGASTETAIEPERGPGPDVAPEEKTSGQNPKTAPAADRVDLTTATATGAEVRADASDDARTVGGKERAADPNVHRPERDADGRGDGASGETGASGEEGLAQDARSSLSRNPNEFPQKSTPDPQRPTPALHSSPTPGEGGEPGKGLNPLTARLFDSAPGERGASAAALPPEGSYAAVGPPAGAAATADSVPVGRAPAGPPAGAPQPSEILSQVVENARVNWKENGGEIRINLHPPNLGSLRIRLTVENKRVRAQIVAQNVQVGEILSAQTHELRQSFLQHGFRLDDLAVAVGDHQPGGSGEWAEAGVGRDRGGRETGVPGDGWMDEPDPADLAEAVSAGSAGLSGKVNVFA